MGKNILRTVFSIILALFLAIGALAGSLCAYAEANLCDSTLLLDTAAAGSYAQELYEEIAYDWGNLIAIAGVPEPETMMTDLTVERVKADALAYLQDAYTGSAAVDVEALRQALEEKVRQYAYSNTIHETQEEELERHIDELVTACMKEYTGSVKIPMLPKALGAISKLGKYVSIGKFAAFGFCAVVLALLFFLQRQKKETLYYAGLSAATNALLLAGSVGLAEHYELLKRLPVQVSALKTLIDGYLQPLLDRLGAVGQIFIFIAAGLLLAYALWTLIPKILENRKNKQTA